MTFASTSRAALGPCWRCAASSSRPTARTATLQPRALSASAPRALSTSIIARKQPSGNFDRPGPPALPANEQREFEKLVRDKQSESCALTPCFLRVVTNAQSRDSHPSTLPDLSPFSSNTSMDSEELHPDVRRKPDPDFDGDTNPTTGEVGGPKKDPLSWNREWTYGGRATDF